MCITIWERAMTSSDSALTANKSSRKPVWKEERIQILTHWLAAFEVSSRWKYNNLLFIKFHFYFLELLLWLSERYTFVKTQVKIYPRIIVKYKCYKLANWATIWMFGTLEAPIPFTLIPDGDLEIWWLIMDVALIFNGPLPQT